MSAAISDDNALGSASGAGAVDNFSPVCVSDLTKRAHNPIRKITETLKKPHMPDKPHIALSLGDPTVFGNLPASRVLKDALITAIEEAKNDGYAHSAGSADARKAVAKWMSVPGYDPLTENDVVIASGCSGALDLAISVLLNPGDNLLIPMPGFSLYQTLCCAKGMEVRQYRLLPERGWEADLAHMESLVDGRTRALLVNNPSNPCGSVYSAEHLRDIVALAERWRLPIIADEVYGNLVFASRGSAFHPLAALSPRVPVLAAGGLAKEFLVPGHRVGWLAIHDRGGAFAAVRPGLFALTQLLLGANTLVCAALPAILTPAAGSPAAAELAAFHARTLATLDANAAFFAGRLAAVPGLRVVVPQGAMYVMFATDTQPGGAFAAMGDDVEFARALLAEENVFVLPGAAFGIAHYCRVVFCAPLPVLADACDRIAAFCSRHYRRARSGSTGAQPLPAAAMLASPSPLKAVA